MDTQQFYNFLNRKITKEKPEYSPQVIYSLGKKSMAWYPGNSDKLSYQLKLPNNWQLKGYTGRYYKSLYTNKLQQDYVIAWAGIDIDDYNNWKVIANIVPEATIRSSKSGKGLHLFFRFSEIIHIKDGEIKGAIVKESLKPYVAKLIDIGLEKHICKWDGNVFWTEAVSVVQPIYRISLKTIPFINPVEVNIYSKYKSSGEFEKELTEEGQRFINFLRFHGLVHQDYLPIKQGIYVKEWYKALKGTPYAFTTKSPMKSLNAHGNGFFVIHQGMFKIFASADNKIIKEIFISEEDIND